MSMEVQRAQIQTILSAVSGVGRVHEYVRWITTEEQLKALAVDGDGKVNIWMITRAATAAETGDKTQDERTHNWKIIGFRALEDDVGSELVFQDTVENVCTAFRSKFRLNDTAFNTEPMQVKEVGHRMYAGVLCHYCKLTMEADEREDWS